MEEEEEEEEVDMEEDGANIVHWGEQSEPPVASSAYNA